MKKFDISWERGHPASGVQWFFGWLESPTRRDSLAHPEGLAIIHHTKIVGCTMPVVPGRDALEMGERNVTARHWVPGTVVPGPRKSTGSGSNQEPDHYTMSCTRTGRRARAR